MKLNKNIFTILAVFLLVISAGAVSAADDNGLLSTDDGNATDVVDDNAIENNPSPVGFFDDVAVVDDPHENPNAYAVEEITYFIKGLDKSIGSPTSDAAGNLINPDGNENTHTNTLQKSNTDNVTAHTQTLQKSNTDNVTAHTQTLQNSSTGNPILALFAVTAVLTGYAIIRRD